jgi:hypothetical protein
VPPPRKVFLSASANQVTASRLDRTGVLPEESKGWKVSVEYDRASCGMPDLRAKAIDVLRTDAAARPYRLRRLPSAWRRN